MKRMIRPVLTASAILAFALISCEKEYRTRSCPSNPNNICKEDTMVNIRVMNETDYILCNIQVKFRSDTNITFNYGTVQPRTSSCYTSLEKTLQYPVVRFEFGELAFITPDSLRDAKKPYSTQYIKDKGNYTLRIYTSGELTLGVANGWISRDL